jgi:glutamate--cysteine ligase
MNPVQSAERLSRSGIPNKVYFMARDTTDQTPLTSVSELSAYLATGPRPADQFRLGTEHEKFGFFRADHSPVPYEGEAGIGAILTAMQERLDWEPIMDGGNIIGLGEQSGMGAISIEPGGQFELSGAPLETLHQTSAETEAHMALVKEITEPMGISFLGMGGSPKWTRAETPRMPKSRYNIMTNYMPKVGTKGLDMMYRTSTIQVNLDFSSEEDMAQKMRVSMKLQSVATALFAASPFTDGTPNGLQSWRGEIWRDTDNRRAGTLPFVFKPDFGYLDYVEWALDVPMYFIVRDGKYHDCTHVTFRQFMNGALKGEVADWAPNLGDWTNHISALPAFWVGLLYDQTALNDADALTADWTFEDVIAMRDAVPAQGFDARIAGRSVLDVAREALRISRAGLKARGRLNAAGEDETKFLAPVDAIAASGRTIASEMLARYHGEWNGSVEPIFEAYQY